MARTASPYSPSPHFALIDDAWRTVMLDPERAGELGRCLIERGRASGDPLAQAHGELHSTFHQVRVAALPQASAALEAARARCDRLGIDAARWLCDDLRGFLEVRRGNLDEAIRIGHRNEALPAQRAARERAITLLLLHTAHHQALHFDEALRYGYKHLALADATSDLGQKAMALNNLSAVHLNVFNVEDALPLQREANAIWTAQQARARLGLSVNNLIAICDALGLHQQAYAALQTWLQQPGGVSAEDLHHYNSRIALALLGVCREAEAEQHLAAGPYRSPVNPRTEVWWTWTRARLLNRQGHPAQARALCEGYLATRAERPVADAPYDTVQVLEALRIAAEALGDTAGALAAARSAHAACVPLVGSSVRARYLSMLLQKDLDAEPRPGESHDRRLQALDRNLRDYGRTLAGATLPLTPARTCSLLPGTRAAEARRSAAQPAATAVAEVPLGSPVDAPVAPIPSVAGPLRRHPFLAHVSHEMRAPLNGMLGMTSLLLLSDLDERQHRLASLAQNSAEVLLRLVNDILDLARMESGQFRLDPRPFALAPLLIEVVEMFRAEAERKQLALTLTPAADLPGRVVGDALRLRQVLTNLVGNAVKFTASGSVAIGAGVRPEGALRFTVQDTGKGISESAQARLFTEFMQEDASTAREHGGTGLGLALSRQLVQAMNGRIGVRSTVGQGSLFWFELVLPQA